MAKLTVLDDFEGPGEKKTAYYLEKYLPDEWHVIHGRQLPNQNGTQIDFFILAENFLFVLEEKYWGPEVAMGDVEWQVIKNGRKQVRKSPAYQVNQNTKKSAGWLQSIFNVEPMTILGSVIMSYEKLILKVSPNSKAPENVLLLDGCEEYFKQIDKKRNPNFQAARDEIESKLLGLASGQQELTSIGDYQIKFEVHEDSKGIRTFWAEHNNSGEEVFLNCFDHTFWDSEPGKRDLFTSRERAVFRVLESLKCAWVVYPDFFFEKKQWWVVPTLKPHNFVSIDELSSEELGDAVQLVEILRQAVTSLSEVHESGVIHKNLNPGSIWVGPKSKVRFSNFRFAHLDGQKTLNVPISNGQKPEYLAPEVFNVDYYSNEKSDVYSLAASLTFGFFKEWSVPDSLNESFDKITRTLRGMLCTEPAERFTLAQALESLSEIENVAEPSAETQPMSAEFNSGSLVSARYEILEKLGEGGIGISWLAKDTQAEGKLKVLKALRRVEDYDFALKEYQATNALKGIPYCSTPRESHELPSPGYLVYDFVPGQTLEQYFGPENIDFEKAKELFAKAVRKLGEVHDRQIIHGDLSPSNLLVDEQENIWLIDFGLVGEAGAKRSGGTPATMSPEAFRGDPLFFQSDIFSLCASFIFVILGRPPYRGDQNELANRDWNLRELSEIEKLQWGDEASDFINVLISNCNEDLSKRAASAEALYEQIEAIKVPKIEEWPEFDAERLINPTVEEIRKLYVRSRDGSSSSLGIDSEFAQATYAPTSLDKRLIPDILAGEKKLIFLTGNAGDGKTSFLQKLREKLISLGSTKISDDSYGWTYEYQNKSITAVNDASESRSSRSRDEILREIIDKYTKQEETVLVAINDGRMQEFFEDNMLEYPDIYDVVQEFFEKEIAEKDDIAIVDLKNRSIVAGGKESILDTVINKLVDERLWEACNRCAVMNQCPIWSNAKHIASESREPVKELFAITHMRRIKRVTLRQMRSTLAWLISGDLKCEDVHQAVDETVNLKRKGYSLPELAFSSKTSDPLVQSWREIDPAKLNSSVVSKHLDDVNYDSLGFTKDEIYQRSMRLAFFRQPLESSLVDWVPLELETRGYRYIKLFGENLENPDAADLNSILRGISRLVSPIFYTDSDLAISKRSDGFWLPLRKFPESEFRLASVHPVSSYLETQPEALKLTHKLSNKSLTINLDIFEVILRCSDGQLMADSASDAIRHEVQRFTNGLIGQATSRILVVEPSGKQNLVELSGGVVSLEQNAGN